MALETAELEGNLVTLERARDYLMLATDEHNEMVVRFINSTTHAIERYCGRKLKSRTYAALVHNGTGLDWLPLRQYPLTTLTAVRERYMDTLGTTRTMAISGYVVSEAGILYLPGDSFTRGWQNIEVDMVAGYKAGTHDDDLATLELAACRLLQVVMQDWHEKIGRGTSVSVGGETVSFMDKPIPEDVRTMLRPYMRAI